MSPLSPATIVTPIRLVVGAGFAYHGYPKLFSKKGHENITSMLRQRIEIMRQLRTRVPHADVRIGRLVEWAARLG